MTKKQRDPFCHITAGKEGGRVHRGEKCFLLRIFSDIVWLGYFLEGKTQPSLG
jgi:hypothetical protein